MCLLNLTSGMVYTPRPILEFSSTNPVHVDYTLISFPAISCNCGQFYGRAPICKGNVAIYSGVDRGAIYRGSRPPIKHVHEFFKIQNHKLRTNSLATANAINYSY